MSKPERVSQPKAAVGLICRGLQILTVKNRRFGGTCLPGGKVEQGETIHGALIREVREETSVEVGRSRFIYAAPGNVEPGRMVYVYLIETYDGEPKTCEPGCDVAWGYWSDIIWCPIFGGFYRAMRMATTQALDSIYRPTGS